MALQVWDSPGTAEMGSCQSSLLESDKCLPRRQQAGALSTGGRALQKGWTAGGRRGQGPEGSSPTGQDLTPGAVLEALVLGVLPARDNRVMKCSQSIKRLHNRARGCFHSFPFFFCFCPLMSAEVFDINMHGLAPALC